MMTVLVPLPGYGLLEKLSLELLASSAPWDSYFVSPGALFSAVGCNHFHFNKSICNNCLNSVLKPTEEKEMTTHSSTLAWKILWMEERGRLQSMGLQRVGHDWTTSLSTSWNSPSTSSSNWNLVISWEQSIPGRLSYTSYSCIQSHVAVGGSSSLFLTGMPIPLDPHSLTNPPIVRLAFWLYHRAPGL